MYLRHQFCTGKHRLERPIVAPLEETNTETKDDDGSKKKSFLSTMFSFISGEDANKPTHVFKKKKIVNQNQYDWWSR